MRTASPGYGSLDAGPGLVDRGPRSGVRKLILRTSFIRIHPVSFLYSRDGQKSPITFGGCTADIIIYLGSQSPPTKEKVPYEKIIQEHFSYSFTLSET